ncbi:MAG: prepilin-type N-terminal cleavage/methylation domain-containing protein [Acidobacteria bacterium]|nr:prepilin-type N-terminal cleavage/methylation domain-containing protein [Acidobacteriota bacterium]
MPRIFRFGSAARNEGNEGFTLVEMLVVVALLAMVTLLIAGGLNGARQRSALNSSATMIKGFLNRVPAEVSAQGRTILVQWDSTKRELEMGYVDGSGNFVATRSYQFPNEVILDPNALTGAGNAVSPSGWPVFLGKPTLACDSMGRLIDPNTNQQIMSPRGIQVTLTLMTLGKVQPKISYLIQVFPVWGARSVKIRA